MRNFDLSKLYLLRISVILSGVFFIAWLLLASVKNYALKNYQDNWNTYQKKLHNDLLKTISKDVVLFSDNFSYKFNVTKKIIKKSLMAKGDLPSIIQNFNEQKELGDIFALYYRTGEIAAYTENFNLDKVNIISEKNLSRPFFVLNNEAEILLCRLDTIKIAGDIFYFFYSKVLKRNFKAFEQRELYFYDYLKNSYKVEAVISHLPFRSDHIYMPVDTKLGLIYLRICEKSLEEFLASKKIEIENFESLLLFLAITLLFIALFIVSKYYFSNEYLSLIFSIIIILGYRISLFFLELPKKFFSGGLIDPKMFDSDFVFGIAKSPLELTITNIVLLVSILLIFNFFYEKLLAIRSDQKLFGRTIYTSILIAVFFALYRSYLASVRSAVFESAYRYFSETGFNVNVVGAVMYLNLFFMGLFALVAALLPVMGIIKIWTEDISLKALSFIFLGINFLGILFDLVQKNSLSTSEIRITFILCSFILSYYALYKTKRKIVFKTLLIVFTSVITTLSLNYFDNKLDDKFLEKELKKFAVEDVDLALKSIVEDLKLVSSNKKIIEKIKKSNENLNTALIQILNEFNLIQKKYPFMIRIFDFNINLASEINVGLSKEEKNSFGSFIGTNAIFEKYVNFSKFLVVSSVVSSEGKILGYINIVCKLAPENFREKFYPGFLKSASSERIRVYKSLDFYEFRNNELVLVYGDYYPDYKAINSILSDNFDEKNQKKLEIESYKSVFKGFAIREKKEKEYIIRAALIEERRDIGIFYNYVKAFTYNLIIAFVIISFILVFDYYKKRTLPRLDFRAKALIAIFTASIVPILAQAYFFRQFSFDQDKEFIESQLKKRAAIVENYLLVNWSKYSKECFIDLCKEADRNLDFNFSIFKNNYLFYSSNQDFYEAKLISKYLNPEARAALSYFNTKGHFTKEKIEAYEYTAYYLSANIEDENIYIKVDECFNNIETSMPYREAEIIVMASVGLSALIMLGLGVALANRISRPIRELEKAALLVSEGDYNVSINVSPSQKDFWNLARVFETMLQNIKKSQKIIAELERESAWKSIARQVAHEIKNPLTPLKLSIQQLIALKKENPEKFEQAFEKITSSALSQIETINRISTEFSYFARLPNPKIEEIELMSLLKELAALFAAEKLDVILLNSAMSVKVLGDREQLKIVFINLFRNSIEAGATKALVSVSKENEVWNIYVQDNGKGIPKGYEDKIFHEGFTLKPKGMGIGLATCKKIVENLNGEIVLDKNTSDGVCFKIKLQSVL